MDYLEKAQEAAYEAVGDVDWKAMHAKAALAQAYAAIAQAEQLKVITEQLKVIADGFAYEAEQRRLARLDAEFGNYTGINVPPEPSPLDNF